MSEPIWNDDDSIEVRIRKVQYWILSNFVIALGDLGVKRMHELEGHLRLLAAPTPNAEEVSEEQVMAFLAKRNLAVVSRNSLKALAAQPPIPTGSAELRALAKVKEQVDHYEMRAARYLRENGVALSLYADDVVRQIRAALAETKPTAAAGEGGGD